MLSKLSPKNIRVIVILITATIAFIIFSMTFGKNLIQGRDLSLQSFALVHFCGYLFFLIMPVEMPFVYCVTSDYNLSLLILIAMGTAIGAQMIDYLIGYSFSNKILDKLFNPRKHAKAIRYIQKYGSLTIFIFNVFPLSSPIICLASGMVKYPFRKVVFFSAAGLIIKYSILGLIFL